MRHLNSILFAAILICTSAALVRGGEDDIDWRKAQQLFNREQRGEKLSDEDQKWLDHAKEVRKAFIAKGEAPWRNQQNPGNAGNQNGNATPREKTGLVPLPELTEKYKEEDGGLYGGGKNEPPPEHLASVMKALAKVQPLDEKGQPSANGRIVFLGVGMSNTTQEFSKFKPIADADPAKSPKLTIVDGAQGGKAAKQWADEGVYKVVGDRLKAAKVTPEQVQVAWVKQANMGPRGELKEHGKQLQVDMIVLLKLLKKHYPNLQVAYLSSRTYGGYAKTPLNPEPYAYEGAFAMRWVIQDQINKSAELNADESRGAVVAPWLLWGPYLWADGTTPRKADGFKWESSDFGGDGTHPSDAGRQKVADLLLKFLKSDETAKKWFLK